ncbi:MAG: hypothetical protein ACO1PB_04760 [Ramlibacter sp.]
MAQGDEVARILYKKLGAGDRRKVKKKSNVAQTGGGARDFRFGRFREIESAVKAMFPTVLKVGRRRKKQKVSLDIYKGVFHWHDDETGQVVLKEALFEPPTTARGSEGRLTKVPDYSCFKDIPPESEGNRILVLLIQRKDGTVWPHLVEEKTLTEPNAWDPEVAKVLIDCLAAKRPKSHAPVGYHDFTTEESYCNGKPVS